MNIDDLLDELEIMEDAHEEAGNRIAYAERQIAHYQQQIRLLHAKRNTLKAQHQKKVFIALNRLSYRRFCQYFDLYGK